MRYRTLGILLGLLLPVFAGATFIVPQGGTGSTTLTGILKGNGTGIVQTAVPNVDYALPGGSGASTTALSDNNSWSGLNQFLAGLISIASSTLADLHTTTLNAATLAVSGISSFNGLTNNGGATTTNLAVTGSSTLSSATIGRSTTTNATSTYLGITGIISSLLKTTSTGGVVAAVLGTDYINLSSLSALFPISYNSGTGVFSWLGLGTTSPFTQGQLAYVTNSNTLSSVATGTISGGGVMSVTANRSAVGGALAIDTTPGTFSGSSRYTFPQDLVITGNSTTTNATTTGFGISGLGTAAGAFLAVNANGSVITTTTPATALSGGATNAITYWTSATTIGATSSNPLYVGGLYATTSATSTFSGPVYVSALGSLNGTASYLRVGSTTPSWYATNNLIDAVDSRNDFVVVNVGNNASAACATADLAVNNDISTVSSNFGDLGHTSSGFTGIGCANNPFADFSANSTYLFDPNGSMNFALASTSLNSSFRWFAGGYAAINRVMTLNRNGLAVGTSTPWAKLSVQGFYGSTSPIFEVASTTAATFATTSYLVVTAGGNIGVKNGSPAFTLDVGGKINTDRFSGYLLNGAMFAYSSSTNGNTLLGQRAGSNGATTSATLLGNTAIGYEALAIATSSPKNTGVGYGALSGLGTGAATTWSSTGQNTCVGNWCLASTTSGQNNTSLGYIAGRKLSSGSSNTFIGAQNGSAGTISGSSNTGLGAFTFTNISSGNSNTSIGYQTMQSLTSGVGNTSIGYQAGINLSTGYDNILIGRTNNSGGNAITTGGGNLLIGYNAVATSTGAVNFLNIGNLLYGMMPATSTATTLTAEGPATNRFGVGTTTPWGTLSINAAAQTNPYFSIGSSTARAFDITPSATGIVSVSTTSQSKILNLGSDPSTTNASSTIRMQKLQWEGLDAGGTMRCTFITSAGSLTTISGTCL